MANEHLCPYKFVHSRKTNNIARCLIVNFLYYSLNVFISMDACLDDF